MLSACSLIAISISNDAFVFSIGRDLLSFTQSMAFDGPDVSLMGTVFAARGAINGNDERLTLAMERLIAERSDTDIKV